MKAEKKQHWLWRSTKFTWKIMAIAIVLIMVWAIVFPGDDKTNNVVQEAKPAAAELTPQEKTDKYNTEAYVTLSIMLNEYKGGKGMTRLIDVVDYTPAQVVEVYKRDTREAWEYSDHQVDSISALAKSILKEIANCQKINLPKIRKKYCDELKKNMWEHDIDVQCTNNGRTIKISGGTFAANKNIKDFNDVIWSTLADLRFTQVQYRWYKEADEYTRYIPYEGKDTELYQVL